MITFHLASDVLQAASVDTRTKENTNSWGRQNKRKERHTPKQSEKARERDNTDRDREEEHKPAKKRSTAASKLTRINLSLARPR